MGSDVHERPIEEMRQVFFRMMTVYGNQIQDWHYVADYAKLAAHDLFWSIPGYPVPTCTDGVSQQLAVQEAFTAVGYPGTTGWVCTCSPDCAPILE